MTKFCTVIILLFILPTLIYAQGVGINNDNSNPDASAMLDVKSNNQGVLVPRIALTATTDLVTIASPATSLLIYNTATVADVLPGFYYFNGTAWTPIAGSGASAGWDVLGNAGTVNGTNFLGTTDAQDLDIRTNNVIRHRLTQQGQLEFLNTGRSVFIGEGAGANDALINTQNVFVGFNAGNSNLTGEINTASGIFSLFSNTVGDNNTANGGYSLFFNTTGAHNTASGGGALQNNTVGNYNTANGAFSLYSNTTGEANTASGLNALFFNTTGNNNTASGTSALYSNTTGFGNTAIGVSALRLNTTGYNNTATGFGTMFYNTTGFGNAAYGRSALVNNTTGYGNTASGSEALYRNTIGKENTASGIFSLFSNTIGNNNTANGNKALYLNTTGSDNVAMGDSALYSNTTGNESVAIGAGALFSDTSNTANTAIGTKALHRNTRGRNNVATGYYALSNNTRGNYNTAIGYQALSYNNTGQSNTAIGHQVLQNNTSGHNNTASGLQALYSNTTGLSNTATGRRALYSNTSGRGNAANGYNALYSNTMGDNNTAFGRMAGDANTAGSSNTFLGYNANATSGALFNATAIGANATVSVGNALVLGNNANVGIGTSSPANKLEVAGGRVEFTSTTDASGASGSGVLEIANSLRLDGNEIITNSGTSLQLQGGNNGDLYVDGTTFMVDASANTVRIGMGTTTATRGRLSVGGGPTSYNIGDYYYVNASSASVIYSNGAVSRNYSIWAADRIAGLYVMSYSDERIKDIVGISNAKEDLNTLLDIEITDYTFKDKVQNGNEVQKKVIAQQVKKVYPQAIDDSQAGIVPDIMQKTSIKEGWIALENVEVEKGEKLRIIFESGTEELEILEVKEGAIQVASQAEGKAFVYGREVPDFHKVDYDALTTLNISATQELHQRIKTLEAENKRLSKVENQYKDLSAEVKNIKDLLNLKVSK